jgi:hypothetical protein
MGRKDCVLGDGMNQNDKAPMKFVASKKAILQIENIRLLAGEVQVGDCYVDGDYFVNEYTLKGINKEVYRLSISFSLTKDEGVYSMAQDEIRKLLDNSQAVHGGK